MHNIKIMKKYISYIKFLCLEWGMIFISKISNAIRMAILLQSRGKMKIKDIANELGVKEKQVRNYRKDLEMAGIYISSEQGPYGGYTLMSNGNLLDLNLSLEELSVIDLGLEQLKYNKYIYSKEVELVVDKIKAVTNMRKGLEGNMNYLLVEPKANYDFNEEKNKWKDLKVAFITKRKVKIHYLSLTSGLSCRIVHPYGLYQYKSDMYMAAYCEKRNKVIDFKVCRIKEYEVVQERFEVLESFNWHDYCKNCIGIYKDGEISLKLKIKYPLSQVVSEKVWVDNQKITKNEEDNSIIFEANMKGFVEIKSWVLSMGSSVEVLEPPELKEEIKKEIQNLKKMY